MGAEDGGILEIASRNGVNIPDIVRRLGRDGCEEGYLDPKEGWEIINYASAAAFEEVLYCDDQARKALDRIEEVFPGKVESL